MRVSKYCRECSKWLSVNDMQLNTLQLDIETEVLESVCWACISKPKIITDGVNVWVNNSDGFCFGRFNEFEMMIRVLSIEVELAVKDLTVKTSFKNTSNPKSWNRFKEAMFQFHSIELPDSCRPSRCKEKIST